MGFHSFGGRCRGGGDATYCAVKCAVDPAHGIRLDTKGGNRYSGSPPMISYRCLLPPIPDALFSSHSKSRVRKDMRVRPPPPAPGETKGPRTILLGPFRICTTQGLRFILQKEPLARLFFPIIALSRSHCFVIVKEDCRTPPTLASIRHEFGLSSVSV